MHAAMNEKELIQDIIDNPRSMGEADQSKKLKQYGGDSGSIIEIRERLRELQSNLAGDEERLTLQENLYRNRREVPLHARRVYDNSILREQPQGLLKKIFSLGGIRRLFRSKYAGKNNIVWSIWNIFAGGVYFVPGAPAVRAMQDMILLQEELREPLRRMYVQGWLDKIGRDVLEPPEFNLICELERMVSDETILNFLVNQKNPRQALRKMNPFLGYYFSVTRDANVKSALRRAVTNSLEKILFNEYDGRKARKIQLSLERLLSGEFDVQFVIPLFECAFMRPFTAEEVRAMVKLQDLEDKEYRAGSNLISLMAKRKKRFTKALKKNLDVLEDEIYLIGDIRESLDSVRTMPGGKKVNIIEYVLNVNYQNDPAKLASRRKNLAFITSDLCDFFLAAYEFLLCEKVNVAIDNVIKNVAVIDPSVMGPDLRIIKQERRTLSEYGNRDFTHDLLNKKKLLPDESIFIGALNDICDSFYSTGEKLAFIIRGHRKSIDGDIIIGENALTERTAGSAVIPYFDRTLSGIRKGSDDRHSITGLRIEEALHEAKSFCFCFLQQYEPGDRDYSGTNRTESLPMKLGKTDTLEEKMKRLEKGEDLDV